MQLVDALFVDFFVRSAVVCLRLASQGPRSRKIPFEAFPKTNKLHRWRLPSRIPGSRLGGGLYRSRRSPFLSREAGPNSQSEIAIAFSPP